MVDCVSGWCRNKINIVLTRRALWSTFVRVPHSLGIHCNLPATQLSSLLANICLRSISEKFNESPFLSRHWVPRIRTTLPLPMKSVYVYEFWEVAKFAKALLPAGSFVAIHPHRKVIRVVCKYVSLQWAAGLPNIIHYWQKPDQLYAKIIIIKWEAILINVWFVRNMFSQLTRSQNGSTFITDRAWLVVERMCQERDVERDRDIGFGSLTFVNLTR